MSGRRGRPPGARPPSEKDLKTDSLQQFLATYSDSEEEDGASQVNDPRVKCMTPGKEMPPRLVAAKQSEWGAACKEKGVGKKEGAPGPVL